MKQRALLLCLVLVLIVGGVAAWMLLTRTEPAPANQFIADAPSSAPEDQRTPVQTPRGQPVLDRPDAPDIAGGQTDTPTIPGPQPEEPIAPPPDGWLVRGRVVSLKVDGVELLGRMFTNELPVGICYRVFGGDDDSVYWLDLTLSANGSFRDTLDFDQLPKDQVGGAWFFAGGSVGGDTPLDQKDLAPETAAIAGLVKPTIRDQVIDLGNLSLEVGNSLQDVFLLVGRLLGPGDRPLASTQTFEIGADAQDEHWLSVDARPNREGRFASALEYDFDDPEAEPLANMHWWLALGSGDDFPWGMRMAGEFAESLGRLKLPSPARTGGVLDFGDIRMEGALIELLVEVEGRTPAPQPGDHLLDEDFEFACFINLEAGDNNFNTGLVPGVMVRLIVPEGRYTWLVELHDPEVVCAPLDGMVAARQGEVARVHAVLKPVPLIPVTVMDPAGNVLKDAQVYWEIEYRPDDWVSGDAVKGNLVPMLPGKTTTVGASHPRFDGTEVEAPAGSTKVTVVFLEAAVGLGHISVKLPRLPKEFGLPKIEARLLIDERALEDCELLTDSQALIDAQSWEPGTYRLRLRISGYYGYPDGVLSEITGIQLKDGDNLELEFPAIAAPPWAVPVGECVTRLTVGGEPASLYGSWVYDTDERRDWIEDGETVLSAKGAKDGDIGSGRIPQALKAGAHQYPLQIRMPTEAWGSATVQLEMPVCVSVRIKRRGTPVESFTAQIETEEGGSKVQARGGVARLWCPPGKADLYYKMGGQTRPWREVVVTDTVSEILIELNEVQVVFKRHDDDDTNWTIATADAPHETDWIETGSPMLLDARKYLIRPPRAQDQSAAFELDLTDGKDREIELPRVEPHRLVDIRIAMSEADWKGFSNAGFWYWQPVDGFDQPLAREFQYSQEDLASRALPDALVLRGVPWGRTILLKGGMYRRADDGSMQLWFLQPCQFVASDENNVTPVWRKGVRLHDEWGDLEIRSASEFAGYWVDPSYDLQLPPGRHEIIVLGPDEKEAARATIDVPADATEFRIPAELRRRLEAAELLEPESEDE